MPTVHAFAPGLFAADKLKEDPGIVLEAVSVASYNVGNVLLGRAQRCRGLGCFRRFSCFGPLAPLGPQNARSRVALRAARPKSVGRALLTPLRDVGSLAVRLGAPREI